MFSFDSLLRFGDKLKILNNLSKKAPRRSLRQANTLECAREDVSEVESVTIKPKKPKVVACREIKERLVTFIFNYRPIGA